jgi:hypothetical protein
MGDSFGVAHSLNCIAVGFGGGPRHETIHVSVETDTFPVLQSLIARPLLQMTPLNVLLLVLKLTVPRFLDADAESRRVGLVGPPSDRLGLITSASTTQLDMKTVTNTGLAAWLPVRLAMPNY